MLGAQLSSTVHALPPTHMRRTGHHDGRQDEGRTQAHLRQVRVGREAALWGREITTLTSL